MSILPLFFDDSLLFGSSRWPSVFESHDLFNPFRFPNDMRQLNRLGSQLNQFAELERDQSITVDKDRFQANIDVQQFKPEEISVKLTDDNIVTIEGKHEEKQDEHGFISRHFVRRYALPEGVDIKQLQSKLSTDGVLSLTAPKKPQGKPLEYKEIPIIKTGQPMKRNEQTAEAGDAPKQS